MTASSMTVTVTIDGGPTTDVAWTSGMNAQDALELAYNVFNSTEKFTYAIQYFGTTLGYLVVMINETYDTFVSSSKPYFYWEFLVNGTPSNVGIDGAKLNAGDVASFSYITYDPVTHASHLLRAKFER